MCHSNRSSTWKTASVHGLDKYLPVLWQSLCDVSLTITRLQYNYKLVSWNYGNTSPVFLLCKNEFEQKEQNWPNKI